ncbi:MAG TPA: flagellar biosynthesis protein FlhA [Rhodopila sp.]|jgi:flagellar biosynthesis protein FlhA|nr:flagellar biosynthesis protein FlhA [Rhodopila sp.]
MEAAPTVLERFGIPVKSLRIGSDLGLAFGVLALLTILVVPLPPFLLDFGLSLSITGSVLILMVGLFIVRPLDFTSFPTLLLISTLLRLSLNVATARLVLSHGYEGPLAAGHVVAAFGGFLMGGDVLIGFIVFAILLVVNFMVITKGSGRIAEVAARFSLDAMPGKQMAIDSEMSAGMINDIEARRRRRELSEESSFYGAMDGAAKFVRGDAIAGLIITAINIVGGLAIGVFRHDMPVADAFATFTTLTIGDGLVSQIPALLVSTAAGIVVTKGGVEGTADKAIVRQLGNSPQALAMVAGTATLLAALPGLPALPFLTLAGLAGAGAWLRHRGQAKAAQDVAKNIKTAEAVEPPISASLQIDALRLELGFALLGLASGDGAKLTQQIKVLRKSFATEMGFVLPPVRVQDNMELPANAYCFRIKELEAGKGELRPGMLLAINPAGGFADVEGERTNEPAFGLPAVWISEIQRQAAVLKGCTVVDLPSVLITHLTELIRGNLEELLSYAETQKLLDGLAKEHQRLVGDLIPAQITTSGVQRVLQGLLAERVSIRDLPTILEGIQEACSAGARSIQAILAQVRIKLARQISMANTGPNGYIPALPLSAEWETAFAESIVPNGEERQLTIAPSKLRDFAKAVKTAHDAVQGEQPVVVCSSFIRPHVRMVIARTHPAMVVLAQQEIHAKARLRALGSI